jgi:hypothetical protein
MLGYLLPLVKRYVEGNVPAKDYLWRLYERFHPNGIPKTPCVVANLEYNEGSLAQNFVVDNFQTPADPHVSSSGGTVTYDVANVFKGLLRDTDGTFDWRPTDPMNGMTEGGPSDTTRGIIFEWDTADQILSFEIVAGSRDISGYQYLSFRVAQGTRHPLTLQDLGGRTFTVSLRDGNGVSSTINVGAYGDGIRTPYRRAGCGTGTGWANEFETIRARLSDFLNNGSGLDLSNVVSIDFNFGPSYGSSAGRLGMDDLEFTLN